MAKSLALQQFPHLSFILPKNKTQLPQRPANSYHVSTMLIWGENDRFAPLWIGRDMLPRLTKRGANVAFNTISEAGHFVQEDQPQKIVPLLIAHWNKTDRIEFARRHSPDLHWLLNMDNQAICNE